MPLDPEPVMAPAPGHVAVHGPSGRGYPLSAQHFAEHDDGRLLMAWAQRDDVTVHVRHHATCPDVRDFDVNPNQGRLL